MAGDEVSLGLLMEIRQQGADIVEQVIQFFEGAKAAAAGASTEASASAAAQSAANAEVVASLQALTAAATEAATALGGAAATGAAEVTAADAEMTAANAETSASMDAMSTSFGMGGLAIAAAIGVAAVAVTGMALKWQDTMTTLANATQLPEEAVKGIGDAMGTLSDRVTFSETALSGALSGVAGQWQQYTGAALDAKSATGLMSDAAQLAMVSHGNLNNVTQDLVQTMIAFKMPASDAATVSDTLYNTSRLTGGSIDSLSGAMDKLKGRLGETSPSLNDIATLTDTLAQNGISGSRGVLMVQSAFTTLLGGSKGVTKELADLGVSIFDSSGKFIGMRGVVDELGPKLLSLGEQQRDLALKTLFGASAGSVMLGVLQSGTAGWDKNSAAVSQAGTVTAGYQNIQADLLTQFDELKNRAEVLARTLGDELLGRIYDLINAVAPYARMIAGFIQSHQQLAQILTITAAAVAATAVAFGIGAAATLALSAATTVLGAVLGATFLPVTLAVVAAVILGYEAYQHWDQITAAFHVTVAALTTAFQETVTWLTNVYNNSQQLQDIWAGLQKAGAALAAGVQTAWTAIQGDVSLASKDIQAGLAGLFKLWDQDGPTAVYVLQDAVRNVFDAIERFIDGGMQAFQASFQSGWATIKDVVQTAMDIIVTTIRVQWDLVSGTVTTVINTLATLISTQFNAWRDIIEGVMNTISDLLHGRWSSVASDLKQILDGIGEVFKGLWQTALTFLEGIIPTFANAAHDLVSGMVAVIHDYLNTFEDSFNALLSGAEGAVEGFVSVFSDLGGKIVQGIIDGITAKAGDAAAAAKNMASGIWDAAKSGIGDLLSFSPSKFGLAIPSGMAQGIQQNTPQSTAAAKAMVTAATAEVKAAYADQLNQIKQSYSDQLATIKDNLTQQSQALASAHQDDLQGIADGYAQQEQLIKDSYTSQIADVQQGMVGLKGAARDGGTQQIADLRQAEADKLTILKAYDKSVIDSNTETYTATKAADKSAAADQLQSLKDSHATQLTELKSALADILAQLKSGAINQQTALKEMMDASAKIAADGGAAAGQAFVTGAVNAINGGAGQIASAAASASAGTQSGTNNGTSAPAIPAGVDPNSPKPGDPMGRTWAQWLAAVTASGGGSGGGSAPDPASIYASLQNQYGGGSQTAQDAALAFQKAHHGQSAPAGTFDLTGSAAAVAAAMATGGTVGTVPQVTVNIGTLSAVDPSAAADIISQQVTQQILAGGRV